MFYLLLYSTALRTILLPPQEIYVTINTKGAGFYYYKVHNDRSGSTMSHESVK